MLDDGTPDKNNKYLSKFSGEYEEIPSILSMNNSIHQYTIEEMFFAVTTNTKRIFRTIHYLKFWAKYPGINCLIVFEEMDFMNYKNITEYLLYEGISCEVQTSAIRRYEERYYELFCRAWNTQEAESGNRDRKKVQWFVVGDDDTIWFVNNLLRTLGYYNSSESIYLGNISDKKSQIKRHGTFYAYGGAGILLSRPLAFLFVQHRQKCKRFLHIYPGDEMIGKCVTEELKINLTKNYNFHQMDHRGDMTGLLESGIDGLVSLHHMFTLWKPFPNAHINKSNETMHRLNIAYITFDKYFLKRYLKVNYNTNRSVLLTMGYSVSLFNRILSHNELSLVEKTWCCDEMVERTTRPKENTKITWYFHRLTTETLTDRTKQEMIYENKISNYSRHSTIKVTLIN
jgi:hypothetical protein